MNSSSLKTQLTASANDSKDFIDFLIILSSKSSTNTQTSNAWFRKLIASAKDRTTQNQKGARSATTGKVDQPGWDARKTSTRSRMSPSVHIAGSRSSACHPAAAPSTDRRDGKYQMWACRMQERLRR